MRRNLATSLKRRPRKGAPMDRYDLLPAPLRHWLAQAALPWSPHSALRLWRRALDERPGDAVAALARLDRAEAQLLRRDAPQVWGAGWPGGAEPAPRKTRL